MFKKLHPDYPILAASLGESSSRILIFRLDDTIGQDEQWIPVDGSQIVIIGQETERQLKRLVMEYGRPSFSEMVPGGIAGRAFPALRKHLGVT